MSITSFKHCKQSHYTGHLDTDECPWCIVNFLIPYVECVVSFEVASLTNDHHDAMELVKNIEKLERAIEFIKSLRMLREF